MKISHDLKQAVGVVTIEGNLALNEAKTVPQRILEMTNISESKGVVLNCTHLNVIDINGATAIVSMYKELKKVNKFFIVSSLNSRNLQMFNILDFHKFIKICETEEDAVMLCLEQEN